MMKGGRKVVLFREDDNWYKYHFFADKAGFRETRKSLHQKSVNRTRIGKTHRERINTGSTSASGCAFCLPGIPGK